MPPPATQPSNTWSVLAIAALIPGPLAMWLIEQRMLRIPGQLGELAVIVLTALGGVVVSVLAIRHRVRVLGGIGVAVNLCIVAFYAFLLLFFGLGGSR